MGEFTYFIPNVMSVGRGKLIEVGLDAVLPDGFPAAQVHCGRGPANLGGTLIRPGDGIPKYEPDQQSWEKSINEKYWLGFDRNKKPNESSLQKQIQLSGHTVELGDGGRWRIPLARRFSGGSPLPAAMLLGEKGEVIATEQLTSYIDYGKQAEKLWRDYHIESGLEEGAPRLSDDQRRKLVIDAIGCNYRMTVNEINALRLLTTENIRKVLAAIIDLPTIEAIAKEMLSKKNDAATDTAGG